MSGPPNLERRGKLVVGALMIGILALTLILLQQRFDQGDNEKAIALLAFKKPGDRWSVNEELVQRAGSGPVECQPLMVSSFRGILEVDCRLNRAEPYRFQVDLVRTLVTAVDPHAQELLDAVAAKNRAPPDAG